MLFCVPCVLSVFMNKNCQMSQQCMKAELLPVFFDIFVLFATYQSPAASSKRLMVCCLQRDFFLTRIFLVSFWQQKGQGWRAVHPRFPKRLSCGWDSFLVRLQQAKRVQPHIATLNAALWSLLLSIIRRLLNYCVPACHHLAGLYVYVVLTIL